MDKSPKTDSPDIPIIPADQLSGIQLKPDLYPSADSSDHQMSISEVTEIDDNSATDIKKTAKYKEINGYIKGEVLGKGQFATVRECLHKESLKRYAVKIMRTQKLKKLGPSAQRNVKQEILLVRKLDHKNVMKMVDIYMNPKNQKIYLFMEYCVGFLTEIIESVPNKRLPKWQSHHYFHGLIDGLKYIHSKGIYHRDIKEDNLLIDNSHVIKIADFGVSYVSDLFKEDDIIDGFEGSKLYQPPELLGESGVEHTVYSGSKFDIWSAGVVLFKMISGLYPFLQNNENIWSVDSYKHVEYPDVIREDKQLMHLFQEIFVLDYKKRISMKGMKNHPWIRLKHTDEDNKKLDFPPKKFGDIYRGITLLERLRVRFEFKTQNEPKVFVTNKEYEESVKPKDPNTRPNRTPINRSPPKKPLTPIRRLIRMGLLFGPSDES